MIHALRFVISCVAVPVSPGLASTLPRLKATGDLPDLSPSVAGPAEGNAGAATSDPAEPCQAPAEPFVRCLIEIRSDSTGS
jgi:hypothetical protein